ncbi:MAG: multiheme c-type cytochrome, partial [Planctomycetota bacterium]
MHRDPAWNHPGLSQAYAQWRSGAAGLTTRVAAARAERGESDSPRLDLETESRRFPPAVNAEMDPLAGHDLLDMDDLLEDTIDPLMQSPPAASSSESVQRPSGVRLPIPDDDGALLNNDDLMTDQQSRGADDLLGDVLLSDDDLLGDDNDLLGSDDDLLGGDDDLLGGTGLGDDDDDPLSGMGAKKPIKQLDSNEEEEEEKQDKDPHADLFTQNLYPSASTCKKCHPAQYEQWRASAHAYSTVSPMFQLFDEAMQKYTRGTVGYFCVRCHSPVAVQLEQPRFTSVLDAPEVTREGVTCIACHRVREAYGRSNGDRRIEPGDIYQPVYGSKGGQGVADAVANAKKYKLRLDPSDEKPGQPIHREGRCFEQLSKSDFCASCHQVAVHPGIWLEVVHAQYRSGPAAAKGITCQDCHMGRVPGKAEGYATGYSAYLNDKPYGQPGKRSNHSFWGPGYSLAHPGVFPFNDDAKRWTTRQWMAFDYRSGWGTKAYEDLEEGTQRPKDETFPKPWDNSDERRDARKIIDTNLKRLQVKRSASIATMEAGSRIDGPFVRGAGYRVGDAPVVARGAELHFHYNVHNISDGHNMPSGS